MFCTHSSMLCPAMLPPVLHDCAGTRRPFPAGRLQRVRIRCWRSRGSVGRCSRYRTREQGGLGATSRWARSPPGPFAEPGDLLLADNSPCGQVRDRSGDIRIVDHVEVAHAASPAGRAEGSVLRILSETLQGLPGGELQQGNEGAVLVGPLEGGDSSAPGQVLAAVLLDQLVDFRGVLGNGACKLLQLAVRPRELTAGR